MVINDYAEKERYLIQQDVELSRRLRIVSRSKGTYVVVEDDMSVRDLIKVIVRTRGRNIAGFSSVAPAKEFIERNDGVSCCVVDINLINGESGSDLVDWLEEYHKDVPIVVFTGDINQGKDVKEKYPWIKLIIKSSKDQVRLLMDALGLRDGPALLPTG